MTSKKTGRALLSSVISLVLCCSMLIGTTFAWFTDTVTSEGNIIKSGKLDVEMYWANTLADIQSETARKNAKDGAIFDYEYWEPGYVDVKYIQLVNAGDLAFQYQMLIQPENALVGMKLAEVIDVYVAPGTTQITRDNIAGMTKLGTLEELMQRPEGVDTGVLLPEEGNQKHIDKATITDEYYEESVTVCLALKMQEEAGNEYMGLNLGGGFAVKLLATQYMYENDSFDHKYEQWAEDGLPVAKVTNLGAKDITALTEMGGSDVPLTLNTALQFEPTETLAQAEMSPYRYYHADFVVSADNDVPANSLYLAGYYNEWCQLIDGKWLALTSDADIPAGTEIRLVEVLGTTVNYEELCEYGNDGTGFLCGVADRSNANAGTTLTVELRLYETTADPSDPSGPKNNETGNYIVLSKYQYTFEEQEFEAPVAKVTNLGAKDITALTEMGGSDVPLTLNTALQFEPTETLAQAEMSPYRYYHADFVVSADNDVPANSLYLAGYYNEWCQLIDGKWLALTSDADIPADTEIRLVEVLGTTINYEELCEYGNDGTGFLCGVSNQDSTNIGTTLTVELRLYETAADPIDPTGPKNNETGNYITISTTEYTFEA